MSFSANSTTNKAHVERGFLLTRQAFDSRKGIVLSFWLKTASGTINVVVENELALFFVEQSQKNNAELQLEKQGIIIGKITDLPLKAFNQQAVTGFYFTSMRDLYRARECLKQNDIKCYEDDFRPDERFLTERFITANMEFLFQENGQTGKQKPFHKFPRYITDKCRAYSHENDAIESLNNEIKESLQVNKKQSIELEMVSLDIECSMQGELYSIGLYSHLLNKYQPSDSPSIKQAYKCILMIGDEKTDAQETQLTDDEKNIVEHIIWLSDEQQLLIKLIAWFTQYDPDIVIGWNVVNFDFNLLQKRCDLYGIDFAIGRDGKAPRWRKNLSSSSGQQFIEIAGRVVLDGIDLLKTATYSFPSFSLDNVASTLLGLKKKVVDVDNRVKEITDNFYHDKLALAAYNLEDCRLVTLIFEHTQLLEFAMLRAQLTGLSINRMGGSVAAFTNLYLPRLHRAGYVAPNLGDGLQGLISPGGYVMDSIPGLYKNVLVLDFKSLYPSIIRTFKIDPMGLIEGLKSPENSISAFDGALFSREQHFLPDIITDLWLERDKAKQDKNAALSQAIKIIMNSFYGVLGSTGCRFFDPRLSGAITKRSHEILKNTQQWIEDKGYQVIYGDTDSIFVYAGEDKSLKESRALGKTLQNFINSEWQKKIEQDFNLTCYLEIEFETHFSQFFMPAVRGQMKHNILTASKDGMTGLGTKKRYVGQIEHKDKTEMVFKGLETVRSDWTILAKEFQQNLYERVFAQENIQQIKNYIKEMVQQTLAGEFDDKLIYRKRIRRKLVDYIKTAPPHVKAARFADQHNVSLGKKKQFENKGWIEYVITVNGPQTKRYQNAVLDYQHYIDKQLKAVADDILPFLATSFAEINDQQLSLF